MIPSGNIYVNDSMPMVYNDATVVDIQRLGNIPLKLGWNVYLRDVATIEDATDITYGYALVNGQKAIHLPIIKKDTGSTLTVVADVHKSMHLYRDAVPSDVKITFEFDESPTVVHAVQSVATEGAIGAGLTGLMILLFLRDLRSVFVVVTNIPMALLGALVGLWLTGNTINIMSLGGMALAIGILVDEATVEIENAHKQMERTSNVATAVARGNSITAVPRLLALLCIGSVFIPAFIMEDPLRSLFMPLTLGVGFAKSRLTSSPARTCRSCAFTCSSTRGTARRSPGCSTGSSRDIGGSWGSSSATEGCSCLPIWPHAPRYWSSSARGSVPNCSPRSTQGNSCCGSDRRPGQATS